MKKRIIIVIIELVALLLSAFGGFVLGVNETYDYAYTDGFSDGYEQGAAYGAEEMNNYYQEVLKSLGIM